VIKRFVVPVLVAVLAAGCSHQHEPIPAPTVSFPGKTTLQVLHQARTQMLDAGSAHSDFEFSLQGGLSFSWDGVADLSFPKGGAGAKEHVSVDLPDLGLGPIGHIEWIVIGHVTYLHASGLRALGARTKWMRIGRTMGPRMRRYFGLLASQQNDPSQIFDLLTKVIQAHGAGTQLIGSTYTDHLVGRVDVESLLAGLPAHTANIRQGFDTLMQRLFQSGMSSLPFEAWVDQNGSLVEIRYSYPLGAVVGRLHGKVTVTYAFSQLGDTFQISPPPKDQVSAAPSG
jgi:hypothetical protein